MSKYPGSESSTRRSSLSLLLLRLSLKDPRDLGLLPRFVQGMKGRLADVAVVVVQIPPTLKGPATVLLDTPQPTAVDGAILFPPALSLDHFVICRRHVDQDWFKDSLLGIGTRSNQGPFPDTAHVDAPNLQGPTVVTLNRLFGRETDNVGGNRSYQERLTQEGQVLVVSGLEGVVDDQLPTAREIDFRGGPSIADDRHRRDLLDLNGNCWLWLGFDDRRRRGTVDNLDRVLVGSPHQAHHLAHRVRENPADSGQRPSNEVVFLGRCEMESSPVTVVVGQSTCFRRRHQPSGDRRR